MAEAGGAETVGSRLRRAAAALAAAGVEGARLDAQLLLASLRGGSRLDLILAEHEPLDPGVAAAFDRLLARRLRREPLSHILGHRAFGVGVDQSSAAAAVARDNADRLGLAARAAFLVGDWAAALMGAFDLVLSNPPYIASGAIADLAPEVACFEPRSALDGGPDGLDDYRALIPEMPGLLAPAGLLLLEVGQGQAAAVSACARAAGFDPVATRADLAGIERVVIAHKNQLSPVS